MDKALFLKSRLPERAVDIPGVGTVRVRGLSRAEAFECQKVSGDAAAMERKALAFGLVDPQLSEDEAAEWYGSATFSEIELIIGAIQELSGLAEGAPKSGLPKV